MYTNTTRETVPLAGKWQWAIDSEDKGRDNDWSSTVPENTATLDLPAVQEASPDGVAWYWHTFTQDQPWDNRHIDLHFASVTGAAEVWLNGVRLGEHHDTIAPFSFFVSPHLQPGDNLLAVRLHSASRYQGLIDTVFLEAKAPVHVEQVFIQPDLRRERITVQVETSAPATLHVQIEGTPHHMQDDAGSFSLNFPDFEAWSPENPKLYTLRVDCMDADDVIDTVYIPFGMREFSVKDQRFHLNSRPMHLKAVRYTPNYPPCGPLPTEKTLRRDLKVAKEAGFNLLFVQDAYASVALLDLADEEGLLIAQDLIPAQADPDQPWEAILEEMVQRDRNHPSLVLWNILHGNPSKPDDTDEALWNVKEDLALKVRDCDPSRLILENSGNGNHHGAVARMLRPYRDLFDTFSDLYIFQPAPLDQDTERYFRHLGDSQQLCFFSGVGFGGPEDLQGALKRYTDDDAQSQDAIRLQAQITAAERGFSERRLERVFGDFSGLCKAARQVQCDAARLQIDAMRANTRSAGYCWHALFDGDDNSFRGVGDRWRRTKPVYKTLQKAQQPVRPLIQMAQTNLILRQEVGVTVTLANEARLEGAADISLQVVGPTNQVLWKKRRSLKLPKHGKELWNGSVTASGSDGKHRFVVRLFQEGQCIAEGVRDFYVYAPITPAEVDIHVLDPNNCWQDRCATLARAENILSPIHIIPPLGNTIRAYPDNDLIQILAQVEGGAVAIMFGPPEDWNELAEVLSPKLMATPRAACGLTHPVYHYAKLHPVFEGLPNRGLMRQTYRNVMPSKIFAEASDEDISGSFDAGALMADTLPEDATPWWGSNLLVRRYGAGRIVFTHMPILQHLGNDPVADRLFVNLLNHFARRSFPSDHLMPSEAAPVEWLRGQRNLGLHRWMVIGEFPNVDAQGHSNIYPPEEGIDLNATYPGAYKAVAWQPCYSHLAEKHHLDLQAAFAPVYQVYPRFDAATGYAYAEFSCDKRQDARLQLNLYNATKIWFNGSLLFNGGEQTAADAPLVEWLDVLLKQGKNTIMVKLSKGPGIFGFGLQLGSKGQHSVQYSWWR